MPKPKILALIFLCSCLLFLPIIREPSIFLTRGNDLEEFFWPTYYFTKHSIFTFHQIPLWNNAILSGTPLVTDPQAPIFYLPNIIFLFLPLDTAFVLSSLVHIALAGLSMFFLTKHILKTTTKLSLLASFLYILSPNLASHIEAGHFGLLMAWAWIPFIFLFTIKLAQSPTFYLATALAFFFSALFYTHLVTFLIIASATIPLYFYFLPKKHFKNVFPYFTAAILTFGLTAIALLPQLAWQPFSTRNILLASPDLYPKWVSFSEFLKALVLPQITTTEKAITLGLTQTFLSLIAFLVLPKTKKTLILITIFFIVTISLNNLSPISFLLPQVSFITLARVTTRFWPINNIMFTLLSVYTLQKFKKNNILVNTSSLLLITESLFISWSYIHKEIPPSQINRFAPQEVYEYLSRDPDLFRVFCTTRCLSQKQAAIFNLQLIEGYNTIQQKNYNEAAWQLTGSYWDYYTLTIPPIGTYKMGSPQPDPKSLGEYNTKYIISPYLLTNPNFIFDQEFQGYKIYLNTLYQPRANTPITYYSPNKIIFDTTNLTGPIQLSEVYSPGWLSEESPNHLRVINPPNTNSFSAIYHPVNFRTGQLITLTTIIIIIYAIYFHQKR